MRRTRKKEHKKVIKYMRKINKHIAADEYVGIDRFRIDELKESWYKYDDNSGGILSVYFTVSDTLTGNTCIFLVDNYDYEYKILLYLNDFMIKCSTGRDGHFPTLNYIKCSVDKIIPYGGEKHDNI